MRHLKLLAAFALALALLAGCPRPTRIVDVPIAVACEVEPIPSPDWSYPRLPTTATERDRAAAMASDFDAALSWGRALDGLLRGL